MKKHSWLFGLFLLFAPISVNAQYTGAWGTAWNNPISASASVMIQGAINRKMLERSIANQRSRSGTAPTARAAPARSSSLVFRPVENSGVAKQLAEALGSDPQQRAQLLQIFQAIKKSYEDEARKGGKSNNIAAALTFFIAAGSMAYHQTAEPDENVTNALVEILEQEMSGSSDFKSMTDLEKQQMHDWLVVTGGFLLAGYLEGAKTNDAKEIADYKQLADGFFKLVLGTGAERFNLAAIGESLTAGTPTVATTDSSPQPASSAPSAMHAAELVKEFETNEVRANRSYVGRRARIYGTVHSIETGRGGNIILTFERSALTYSNVRCFFPKSQSSRIADINANQEVTVEGTVRGLGGGALGIKAFLILENCTLQ